LLVILIFVPDEKKFFMLVYLIRCNIGDYEVDGRSIMTGKSEDV
jgi:hypothetical protein